jgi:hypothetical protein
MRCLEAPARLAQDHTVTHRHGSGDMPSHVLNSDPCLKVEMLPPEALKAYPGNARTHSKKQIRQIAKSIERFGFCNPVLIGDNGQIIAGHGRVAAAKLLGLLVVPTVRLSHLSEAERRAYILADNRLAERAGWDREILAIELQALIDLNFEVELIGFETAEIDLCLEEAKEASGEASGPEDVIPAYTDAQAVSRPGDLWVLGPHLLLCADARSAEAYGQLLGDTKAAFVFTDPPYNVPIDGHVCGLGRIRHRSFAMGCGEMSSAEFTGFLMTIFRLQAAHSTDGSIHQICMDWRHMDEMLEAGNAVYSERTSAFGTRATPAWARSTGRSTSLSSSGRAARHLTSIPLSSVSTVGTVQTSGTIQGSAVCPPAGLKSSPCIRPSSQSPWWQMRSKTAPGAMTSSSIPLPAAGRC